MGADFEIKFHPATYLLHRAKIQLFACPSLAEKAMGINVMDNEQNVSLYFTLIFIRSLIVLCMLDK